MKRLMLLRFGAILIGSLFLLSMSHFKLDQQDEWEVPPEYQSMNNPYSDIADKELIGEEIYGMYCQSCHGIKGAGDGINAHLIETPVADFTSDAFKNQTDGSLYYKIYTGRNEMPAFERIIPEEEDLWMVVNYVKNM